MRLNFLLRAGLLFTHWIADSLTLWKSPSTDERLWTAATYYAVISRMPPTLLYVYGAVALVGASTLMWSLFDGNAGNLMFDGGSICTCAPVAWSEYNSNVMNQCYTRLLC